MLMCVVVLAYLGIALQRSCVAGESESFIIALFAPFGVAIGIGIGIQAWRTVFSKSKICTYNWLCKLLIFVVGGIFLFGGLLCTWAALFAVGL
ncbi:MAG: hypothetical protein IKR60_00415, partial [Alphaproteobacteria bacterium]|nr:hypothetical protein [Alphaproteobacteria bacterium]